MAKIIKLSDKFKASLKVEVIEIFDILREDYGATSIQSLGLSEISYKKLSKYTKALSKHDDEVPAYASQILSALDLIVSDNDLLYYALKIIGKTKDELKEQFVKNKEYER